jgi:hypothetical protein
MEGFAAMQDVDGFRKIVEATRIELDAALRERESRRS